MKRRDFLAASGALTVGTILGRPSVAAEATVLGYWRDEPHVDVFAFGVEPATPTLVAAPFASVAPRLLELCVVAFGVARHSLTLERRGQPPHTLVARDSAPLRTTVASAFAHLTLARDGETLFRRPARGLLRGVYIIPLDATPDWSRYRFAPALAASGRMVDGPESFAHVVLRVT